MADGTPRVRRSLMVTALVVMALYGPAIVLRWGWANWSDAVGMAVGIFMVLGFFGSVYYGLFYAASRLILWPERHRLGVRERRWADRQCIYCGYDVRATPGRCPECGQAVERWWA